MKERVFTVQGMHCSACAAAVERSVKKLEGCEFSYVNFASGELTVRGDISDEAVLRAISNAGFKGALHTGESDSEEEESDAAEARRDFRDLMLAWSFGILLYTAALSAPAENFYYNGLLQLLLLFPILWAGSRFFHSGFPALFRGHPDMDSLIATGAASALLYSCIVLFVRRNGHLFFDTAGMILMFIMLGKFLEGRARRKASGAVRELAALAPESAIELSDDGRERELPLKYVRPGMKLKVLPGARIPADGIILSGNSGCDESMLTGEALPVPKVPGDSVSAGTVNTEGVLILQATHTGNESTLGRIIALVRESQGSRAPVARLADRVSAWFVWGILGVALITFTAWLLAGAGIAVSLGYALGVLVAACPCSLGLATPVALITGIGQGAKCGLLIRNGGAVEELEKVKTMVFDKTGTLTCGKFRLREIRCFEGKSEEEVLKCAAALEKNSTHPLGSAIVSEAEKRNISLPAAEQVKVLPGQGVEGFFNGVFCEIGRLREPENMPIPAGVTAAEVRIDRKMAGILLLEDTPKADAAGAVARLKELGIIPVMLTGDNPGAAARIAALTGIKKFQASLLPAEKVELLKAFRKRENLVAMVGDGINDAPSLAAADVGIALGSGSAAAIEAADVVLPSNQLKAVVSAVRLSREMMKIIRQNLWWAFGYNAVMIPFASGAVYALTGYGHLPPALCAAAMGASSLTVVLNALRLRRFRGEA